MTRRGTLALALGLMAALTPATTLATSPGDNGPIVWQSYSDTDVEIWRMGPTGGNPHAITSNSVHDERPAISSDAQRVAFQSYRAGDGDVDSFEIYKMNADGSGETALTDDDDTDFEPAWSPDGTKVIFMRQSTGIPAGEIAGQDLWTVNAGGGGETNLTNSPATYECCAEYSPDGAKIAYTNSGNTDGDPMTPNTPNNVWVMDANGANPVQLTFGVDPEQNLHPTWSPDGDQIAYLHTPNGSNVDYEIYVMDADGDNKTPITDTAAYEYAPVWSPDGTKIAFEGPGADSEIVTIGITLSPPGLFTPLTNNSFADAYPSWAPAPVGGSAPNTKITAKPADVIHRPKATYKFKAIPALGASFKCKLDSKPYKRCSSPKTYRNLANGKHTFKVRASGPDGTDRSPATDSFKVKP